MKILKIIAQYLGPKGDNHIIQLSKKQTKKKDLNYRSVVPIVEKKEMCL